MRSGQFLLLTVLFGALTACSRVQLVYNQLDWLLPYYLETYMELSDEQSAYLERQVGELLIWHCSTQLTAYADLLREANTDFQLGHMTPERLGNYSARVESYWRQIAHQASPTIAGLLLEASDEQLEELFYEFEKRNNEWLAEYRETTNKELHEDYQRRMTKELERWFGPLSATQQQAVLEWSEGFVPLAEEGLKMRQRWQARLRELVSQRDDVPVFRAGITELVVNPAVMRTPVYQARLEYNHRTTIALVHRVGAELTEEQRQHLAHQTTSLAQDFDQLACEREAPRGTGRNVVLSPRSSNETHYKPHYSACCFLGKDGLYNSGAC